MGITKADFFRTLSRAMGDGCRKIGEDRARVEDRNGVVILDLSNPRDRQLGSLAIPSLTVEFDFTGYSREETGHFMERFDTHFRRGGG